MEPLFSPVQGTDAAMSRSVAQIVNARWDVRKRSLRVGKPAIPVFADDNYAKEESIERDIGECWHHRFLFQVPGILSIIETFLLDMHCVCNA
jgi:hypothetical protein